MTAPVLGPCAAWIDGADVQGCCHAAAALSPTDPLLAMFAVEASQVLYELSGRRFSGLCTETVRPCASDTCGMAALGVGIIPGWGGYGGWGYGVDPWGPWGWSDQGIGSAGLICGCQALSQIRLAYPVAAVSEVKIDGVVVDPSTYRVDEWSRLVRTADTSTTPPTPRFWPSCQNLMVGDDQPGTFSVTYTHGVAPPPIGASAAAQLACQLYMQCQGAACQLPQGATKITRQGVTIDRGLLANWFLVTKFGGGWSTGLALVDAFLTAYNPKNLRRRPAVWTPDVTIMPRRVGT